MESLEMTAASMVNNHAKFELFAWFERLEDAHLWTIYYTDHRDSDALDRSNAAVMAELFTPYVDSGDMRPEDHGHWAVGWIKGYAIRVYTSEGAISDAFKALYSVLERLDQYPVLDDEKWSELEDLEAFANGCYFCGYGEDNRKNYVNVSDLGDGTAYVHAACARLASMRGDRDGQRAWAEVKESMRLSA